MRRTLLAMVIVLGTAAGVDPAHAQPSGEPWTGEPTNISGTSRYDDGEWIYTDFVYDDYGADTIARGQPNVVSLAPTNGDFRYPNGTTETGNAADIVEVRARISPDHQDDLEVRVLFQSMVAGAEPGLWVEVNGEEGVVTASTGVIDRAANTLTFVLESVVVDATLTLNIGAGLAQGSDLRAGVPGTAYTQPGEFTTGGPAGTPLFDLAFNTRELEPRGAAWNEVAQSAALAQDELDPFRQTIDLSVLAAGTTTPSALPSGLSVRLFESRQDLGEGMRGSFPQYRGRWQPYALWVPQAYEPDTAAPLFLNMHSLSVHHNQYRGGPDPGASYPTMYEQIEDALDAIVVTPLARGPDGWYQDEGLIDTLEVWADALNTFTIDRERIYVGGYSMGGFGTYRLGTLMPDAFASAVSVVGPPSSGIWAYPLPPTGGASNPTFTYPQLESMRHLPIWITQGVQDELVPFTGVTQQALRFGELGHEYRFALHPVGDHFAFVFQDEWSRELGWLATHPTRVTDPRRVTLDIRPASWSDDPVIVGHLNSLVAELEADITGGYWIDDVAVAPGMDVTGVIDLTSGGIARAQTDQTAVLTAGVDGPSPHVLSGQDQVFSDVGTADTLTGSLSNVTALTVDVERAGLSDSPTVAVDSNVAATITFVRGAAVVGTTTVAPA